MFNTFSHLSVDALASLLFMFIIFFLFIGYGIFVLLHGRMSEKRLSGLSKISFMRYFFESAGWATISIARFLARHNVSPNLVSVASLIAAMLSGFSFYNGHYGILGILIFLSGLFDAWDGVIARFSNTASEAGEIFDLTADRYSEFFIFAGLLLYYQHSPILIFITFAVLHGSAMVTLASAKAELAHVKLSYNMFRKGGRVVLSGF